MEGTRILRCTCKHEDQDKMYGHGMRVHNVCDKKASANHGKYYCTVCQPNHKNKVRTTVSAMPHLGMHSAIIGCGNRMAKSADVYVETKSLNKRKK